MSGREEEICASRYEVAVQSSCGSVGCAEPKGDLRKALEVDKLLGEGPEVGSCMSLAVRVARPPHGRVILAVEAGGGGGAGRPTEV